MNFVAVDVLSPSSMHNLPALLFFRFRRLLSHLFAFLIFILHSTPIAGPALPEYPFISCFSCASEDYEPIFLRANSPALFGRPVIFDRLCDSRLELAAMSSSALVPCDSTCISMLEPQFFGGVQNERRPFTFVRGCASDIFELAIATAGPEGVPAEIEFLHRAQACLELPINQIWPQLGDASGSTKELVRVCSCANDECNIHDDLSTAKLSGAERRIPDRINLIWLIGFSIFLAISSCSSVIHNFHSI